MHRTKRHYKNNNVVPPCEAVKNCHFKQLKRLEKENEELKKENKTLEQFLSKEPLALQALQKGYASYKKSTDVFFEMVKEYKQTLQEIREIVLENPWEETDNWIKDKILKVLKSEE